MTIKLSMLLSYLFLVLCLEQTSRADEKSFYDPVEKQLEGWTIKIDPKLLSGKGIEVGTNALEALANHLQRVKYIVPKDQLARLRELPIWLELDNPELGNMQYHPDRGWLLAHGHDPRLVKHVHIPRAKNLFASHMWAKHPYVVLHELAHSYHDQVLTFDHPEIVTAYKNAKEKGIYEDVLLYTGRRVRHYGLNNHKEYFAEATEAYFGVNDFYPFVRAELREHDPGMFAIMEKFWGKVR
jgi:dipeptidyl-peptidase-4